MGLWFAVDIPVNLWGSGRGQGQGCVETNHLLPLHTGKQRNRKETNYCSCVGGPITVVQYLFQPKYTYIHTSKSFPDFQHSNIIQSKMLFGSSLSELGCLITARHPLCRIQTHKVPPTNALSLPDALRTLRHLTAITDAQRLVSFSKWPDTWASESTSRNFIRSSCLKPTPGARRYVRTSCV